MKQLSLVLIFFVLIVAAMLASILRPADAEADSRRTPSNEIRIGRCKFIIKTSRRRWSIGEEGFTQKPKEAWVNWDKSWR